MQLPTVEYLLGVLVLRHVVHVVGTACPLADQVAGYLCVLSLGCLALLLQREWRDDDAAWARADALPHLDLGLARHWRDLALSDWHSLLEFALIVFQRDPIFILLLISLVLQGRRPLLLLALARGRKVEEVLPEIVEALQEDVAVIGT